jgi:AmiR/NasT family two-component response regulator
MVTIVILTSSMNSDDMKKAMSLGVQRYITKPLTEEDVSKIVLGI